MSKILDISLKEYLEDPAPEPSLTRSLMVTLLDKSPYHAMYDHPRLNASHPVDTGNKAMNIGSAAHNFLLEQDTPRLKIINAKDYRTKAAQEERDSAFAEGLTPLLNKEFNTVMEMNSIAKDAINRIGFHLKEGKSEQTIIWQNGCWLRTRPDWNDGEGTVIEYKTTTLAPNEWTRSLASKGYDIQAAMHQSGMTAVTGEPTRVIFCVQNTEPPYSVFFREISPMYYEMAFAKIKRAVDLWSTCLKEKHWPDYGTEIVQVDPSNWQLAQEEEKRFAAEGYTMGDFLIGRVPKDD